MSEAGAAITRFDFDSGAMRGSSITLHASCLVHRSDFQLETLPLAALGSVRLTLGRGTTEDDVAQAAEALVRSWRQNGNVFAVSIETGGER